MEENKEELKISIESSPEEAFYAVYAGLKLFIEHKSRDRKVKNKEGLYISEMEAQSILYGLEESNPELSENSKEWFEKEISTLVVTERQEEAYTIDQFRAYLESQDSIGDALYHLKNLKF